MHQPPIFKVIITFEHIGWHCWPKAPPSRSYLRNDHRHLFKFKVELQVEAHDREIELHDLKDVCLSWAERYYIRASTDSCEKMAELLLRTLYSSFQPLSGRVECWEDGEVGGACEMSWPQGGETL